MEEKKRSCAMTALMLDWSGNLILLILGLRANIWNSIGYNQYPGRDLVRLHTHGLFLKQNAARLFYVLLFLASLGFLRTRLLALSL